jgi:hypothetical protein
MTIAQPFKVGFEAQKIRLVPNGTADFNYKAFLFELTQDILHSVVPLGLNATVNSWYPTFKGWAIVKDPSGIRAKS